MIIESTYISIQTEFYQLILSRRIIVSTDIICSYRLTTIILNILFMFISHYYIYSNLNKIKKYYESTMRFRDITLRFILK